MHDPCTWTSGTAWLGLFITFDADQAVGYLPVAAHHSCPRLPLHQCWVPHGVLNPTECAVLAAGLAACDTCLRTGWLFMLAAWVCFI